MRCKILNMILWGRTKYRSDDEFHNLMAELLVRVSVIMNFLFEDGNCFFIVRRHGIKNKCRDIAHNFQYTTDLNVLPWKINRLFYYRPLLVDAEYRTLKSIWAVKQSSTKSSHLSLYCTYLYFLGDTTYAVSFRKTISRLMKSNLLQPFCFWVHLKGIYFWRWNIYIHTALTCDGYQTWIAYAQPFWHPNK